MYCGVLAAAAQAFVHNFAKLALQVEALNGPWPPTGQHANVKQGWCVGGALHGLPSLLWWQAKWAHIGPPHSSSRSYACARKVFLITDPSGPGRMP